VFIIRVTNYQLFVVDYAVLVPFLILSVSALSLQQ
jgi:hypothetical protein